MKRIDLDELGPPREVELTAQQGHRLAASGVVGATPSPYDPGRWVVRAAGKVGVARVGDVELRIAPKVRIDRLLFMLGYALGFKGWREEDVAVGDVDDLVPALAHTFARQAERAVLQGLLQGYKVEEDALLVLRGRLREADQLRRRFGRPLPVEVTYDEFTVDVVENQLLRTATERLLRLPRVGVEARRRLRHLMSRFVDVSSLPVGRPLPSWQETRLNARYHVALALAEMVLRATSVEHREGPVRVNGFLIDVPKVFEDLVTVALGEALAAQGRPGRAVRQDRHRLDTLARVPLRPDLVWYVGGSPAAVVDAKYKAEKPSGFPNADLYQMLAYCTVLGLRRGHLVYAAGNEEPARYTVTNAGVEIVCHTLDLAAEPRELLARVAVLASRIAGQEKTEIRLAQPQEAV